MRTLLIGCTVAALATGAWTVADAQSAKDTVKDQTKTASAGSDVRYFNSLGDLLGDLPVDAFIKETRQGGKVVSALLDVCYSLSTTTDRKDRFVVDLKVDGETLRGNAQSSENRTPVSVTLTRKQNGKSVSFDGKIMLGTNLTSVSSADNSDVSEKDFQQSQATDDDLTETPKDFTQVSPQSVAVRVKRENFADLLKSLRDKHVQVGLDSIATDCNALRSDLQMVRLVTDPARAPDLIASLKTTPGVEAAGWSSGSYDMERAIRFNAAEWTDGGKLDRDKFANAVMAIAAKAMSAKPSSAQWSETTGELTFSVKRPSSLAPALGFTETLEFTALVGPDKPGTSDRLVLWLGVPSSKTTDDAAGSHLEFADSTSGDEEGSFDDDDGVIRAVAAAFKGQRWDSDKTSWK